jgi:hypothetical protein
MAVAAGAGSAVPFQKDVSAGIRALPGLLHGTYIEDWKRARKAQDLAHEALRKQYGKSYLAGELGTLAATSLVPGVGAANAESALAAKAAPYLGELGSKALAGGVGGAGIGALYGAGEGETLGERARNIASGAGMGLAGGAALPYVGTALKKGASKVGELAQDVGRFAGYGIEKGGAEKAEKHFEKLLSDAAKSRTGLGPADVSEAAKFGQEVLPIDVMGKPGQGAAKLVSTYSPEAEDTLKSVLGSRAKGQQQELGHFVSENILGLGGKDIMSDEAKRAIREEAKLFVPEHYNLAYKANPHVGGEELERILRYPSVQKEIPKALERLNESRLRTPSAEAIENPFTKSKFTDGQFVIGTRPVMDASGQVIGQASNNVPLELWDQIKRGLSAKADKHDPGLNFGKGNRSEFARYVGASEDLTKALKKNATGYTEALEGAGKYLGEESAWNLGSKFGKTNDPQMINAIKNKLTKLSPKEQEHFAHAYTQSRIAPMMSVGEDANIARKLTPIQRAKDIAAFGVEKGNLLHAYLNRMNIQNQSLSGLAGSDTVNKMLAAAKQWSNSHGGMLGGVAGAGYDIMDDIRHGKPIDPVHVMTNAALFGLTGKLAGRYAASNAKMNEVYARRLAEMLVSPNPQDVQKAMQVVNSNPAMSSAISKANIFMQQLIGAETARPQRASGGKVDKKDYPAKRLTRMERALKRAQDSLAEETKPIMSLDDSHVAQALHIAKEK